MTLPAIKRPLQSDELADYAQQVAASIPEEMRMARRWLVWKWLPPKNPAKEKWRKVPYCVDGEPRSGQMDTPADVARLGRFGAALQALDTGKYAGLGFALGPDGTGYYWQGVDFDELRKRPQLSLLAEELPGYTEDSPSGDGRHAIGYGRRFSERGSNGSGIEAYCEKRFFTVTGDRAGVGEICCLADHVERALDPLHAAAKERVPVRFVEAEGVQTLVVSDEVLMELRSALLSMRADDRALWIQAGHAMKTLGERGRKPWMEWSATSDKFDPADASHTWDSFKPTAITYKAVFTEAQQRGWVNPRSKVAQLAPLPAENYSAGSRSFRLLTADDIRQLPPIRWLVREVLPDTGVAAVYGQSGSGKSFLVLDLAAAIAGGREWFGRKVRQTNVVYVCLEGEGGLRQRQEAWEQRNGAAMPAGFRSLLEPFSLAATGDVEALAAAVCEEVGKGAVVVLDTLNRAAAGVDENSSKEMGAVIASAKRLQSLIGGLVLLVHHSGKDETRGPRGHSSLVAALDASVEVKRSGPRREWQVRKSKDGRDDFGEAFLLETVPLPPDAEGEPVTSCVVAPLGASIDLGALGVSVQGVHQAKALEVLRKAVGENGALSQSAAMEEVAAALKAEPKYKKQRAKEALEGLAGRGVITLDGGTVRLMPASRNFPESRNRELREERE